MMISPIDIINIKKDQGNDDNNSITDKSFLVGGHSSLDSMGLVELCMELQDKASDLGFSFDWSSEKAMSSMNSIFKTPTSLAEEFNRQMAEGN